jgi:hypothetical protein
MLNIDFEGGIDKAGLVDVLHKLTELFKSFVSRPASRGIPFDGGTYLEYPAPAQINMDPETAVWFARVSTTEALLEYQDSSISVRQINYLRSWLLGGMLSLNDFSFESNGSGRDVASANAELDMIRGELYLVLSGQSKTNLPNG